MSRTGSARVVLVTGGTGGLGPHVVARFLEEGAAVHVPVRRPGGAERVAERAGTDASRIVAHENADLSRPEAVERVFREVAERAGRGPDVLLNLAGGFTAAPIAETAPATWQRMLDINATTAFLCSRAAFPGMKERGWGRIVNVSALPVLEGLGSGLSAYGAAKAAVLALTRSLSREGVGHGVTVNALLPSVIDTPANRRAMPDADPSRWVSPKEIAAVCSFLASDDAGSLTGGALPLRRG